MEDNILGYLYVMNYETEEIIEIPYIEVYDSDEISNHTILEDHGINPDVCDVMYSENKINRIIPINELNNE